MKYILTLFILSVLMLGYSCQQEDNMTGENKSIQLDEKSARLVEADNAFGLDIFQKIRKDSEKDNIMISPLSISVALAMAYNGAEGDTKTEMEHVLKLNGLSPDQINNSYKILIDALQSVDEDVVFEIANAIFYANGFSVKPDYLNVNSSFYDAEVESLNFSSPAAVDQINSWVAEKTHDKITRILNGLSEDDRMVLLNAIYFYGSWATEFNEDGTKMRIFHKADGTAKEVPMMNKEDKLEYTTNSLFSAVKLPYGNGQYNMVVLLPSEGENSQNIIDKLTEDNWKAWAKDFNTEDHVVVTMPRFKFDFDMGLKKVLKQMGMTKAFSTSQADFSNISEEYLYISSVIHKSFIDVNETGTEAAAVTAIVMTTTSVGPGDTERKIYFTVDKPFVFAITERDTEAILFIGEVKNPEYEK